MLNRLLFVSLFISNSAIADVAPSYHTGDLSKALESSGVFELRKILQTDTPPVSVVVWDNFREVEDEEKLPHGESVSIYLQKVAPNINLLKRPKSKRLDLEELAKENVRVVNKSSGHNNLKTINKKHEDFRKTMDHIVEMAKMGIVVVKSAGNDSQIIGASTYTRVLVETAEKINSDPNIPGAFIFAGSGVQAPTKKSSTASVVQTPGDDPILSTYSSMAGNVRDYYVFVPTSQSMIKVMEGQGIIDPETNELKDLFARKTGTSFSAPTVSGMITLLMQAFPDATGKQIVALLLNSAEKIPSIPKGIVPKIEMSANIPVERLLPEDIFGQGRANVLQAYKLGKETDFEALGINRLNPNNKDLINRAQYDFLVKNLYIYLKKSKLKLSQLRDAQYEENKIGTVIENYTIFDGLDTVPLYYVDTQTVRPYPQQVFRELYNLMIAEGYSISNDKEAKKYTKISLFHAKTTDDPLRKADILSTTYEKLKGYPNVKSSVVEYLGTLTLPMGSLQKSRADKIILYDFLFQNHSGIDWTDKVNERFMKKVFESYEVTQVLDLIRSIRQSSSFRPPSYFCLLIFIGTHDQIRPADREVMAKAIINTFTAEDIEEDDDQEHFHLMTPEIQGYLREKFPQFYNQAPPT